MPTARLATAVKKVEKRILDSEARRRLASWLEERREREASESTTRLLIAKRSTGSRAGTE